MPELTPEANHTIGNFDEARDQRLETFMAMAITDPARPGVAGTLALTEERLGNYEDALIYARTALDSPKPFDEAAADAVLRDEQQPSMRLNIGTVYMRTAARARLANAPQMGKTMQRCADTQLWLAKSGIEGQRTGPRPHQHAINLASRLAMSEAVHGDYRQSFKMGLGALALARLSESPDRVEHTTDLDARGRLIAKGKAAARAVTALAVATTALPGIRQTAFAARARDRMIIAKRFGA